VGPTGSPRPHIAENTQAVPAPEHSK